MSVYAKFFGSIIGTIIYLIFIYMGIKLGWLAILALEKYLGA